jgi:hypothetical protein
MYCAPIKYILQSGRLIGSRQYINIILSPINRNYLAVGVVTVEKIILILKGVLRIDWNMPS